MDRLRPSCLHTTSQIIVTEKFHCIISVSVKTRKTEHLLRGQETVQRIRSTISIFDKKVLSALASAVL